MLKLCKDLFLESSVETRWAVLATVLVTSASWLVFCPTRATVSPDTLLPLQAKEVTVQEFGELQVLAKEPLAEVSAAIDLVLISIYGFDEQWGELYASPLAQASSPGTFTLPQARYWLAQNNLFARYRKHLEGECYFRTFEQTGTGGVSCPIFDKGELWGYIGLEHKLSTYAGKAVPIANEEKARLENLARIYAEKAEAILSLHTNQAE